MQPARRKVPTGPPARARLVSWLVAGLLAALGVLTLAATPSWSAPAGCTPDAGTGCLSGTIRTSGGEPAVGVSLTAEGPGEAEPGVTDDTGRWSIAVTEPGEYAVTLDESTLPSGETLRDPANNPRTVTVGLGGTVAALFPLGPPAPGGGPTTDPGDGATTGGGTGGQAPGGDDEVGAAPETESATGGSRIYQLLASGLILGLLLALASVGLSLIYGTTGLSNFAHGEQITLGAMVGYLFMQVVEETHWVTWLSLLVVSAGVGAYLLIRWSPLSRVLALSGAVIGAAALTLLLTQVVGSRLLTAGVIAVGVGAASGWVQDAAIWAPLTRRRVGLTQQMIVTIGLAMALQYTFHFFAGGGTLRIVTSNPPIVDLGPISLTQQSAISVVIAVVVLGGMAYFLLGTRVGRATRAVSDNPALASASGIGVTQVRRLVWVLGAGMASLGGLLIALYFGATRWNMGAALLMLMFAAVTLGGLGAALGALAGSVVIGLVVELSTLVLPSDMRYASALLILILILLFRPQGLLGRAERVG